MKKVFTFLTALVCFGFAAKAQRSADLVLLNSLRTQDTISYNTGGTVGITMLNAFVNNGPSALTTSDTLIWKSVGNGINYRLSLPATGMPVGDTLYIQDTIIVNAAPTVNPLTWCDSLYARTSGVVIPDPNIANNRSCKTVFFKKVANVGISSVKNNNDAISTYPNPANNNLNVTYVFSANEAATLIMRDLLGKVVMSKDLGKNVAGKQTYSLDVSKLSNGIYMLEINSASGRAMSKVNISK